jgi:Domain of unknown function (DUF397)
MWRTSRRCESGACVEVGKLGEIIMVRRSADPDGTCLKLSRGEWQEFIAGLKVDSSTVRRPLTYQVRGHFY